MASRLFILFTLLCLANHLLGCMYSVTPETHHTESADNLDASYLYLRIVKPGTTAESANSEGRLNYKFINQVQRAIKASHPTINIVDNIQFIDAVQSGKTSDTPITVADLIELKNKISVTEDSILVDPDYLVLIRGETTSIGTGTYIPFFLGVGTSERRTQVTAWIFNWKNSYVLHELDSVAHGHGGGIVWIVIPVGVIPETESKTASDLGNIISNYIMDIHKSDNPRVLVLLGKFTPSLDMQAEDMTLRKLGQQGDTNAQKLWKQSSTYYTSQQKDIVDERKQDNEKSLAVRSKLSPDLKIRAKHGDAEAQFNLYMLEDKTSPKWLCRAADQGYTMAETWLGYLYETGSYNFPRDYSRSYLWYRRAALGEHQQEVDKLIVKIKKEKPKEYFCKGISCEIARNLVSLEGRLNDEGTSKVESMLDQWKPGQCEKDLLGSISDNG
jgi:hypothetical protein